MEPERELIVIGAGIIGATAALALQRAGHKVRLVDRKGIAAETSRGNAGAFAFSEVEPLATPGILRKAPKWLFDPLGPLSLRPAHAARMLPWMLCFASASRPARYEAAVAAQAALMAVSQDALARLVASCGAGAMLRREGQMQLYESAADYRASLPSWELRRCHGIRFELLDSPGALAEIQPGLSPRFTHAGFTPDWTNVTDPLAWTEMVAARFLAEGGTFEQREVRALRQVDGGVVIDTATGPMRAAQAVVAAGAWSKRLARSLGDRLPLETERGYNTTFPAAAFDLRTHLTFSAHGFVISRIGQGLRVGGAVELGGPELPPDYRRSEILVEKARAFLPGFAPEDGTQWMGCRPSMPDSLPVIGRAPGAARVLYAFGHGHLGLTQSAGTAAILADLAAGRDPAIPLAPYAASRFRLSR
ncbi:FAD-binding oxidoreductase [Poseidonocella sp. HB161398]|uniref:NAD(P)/FAD-dependent oxidoreductase n=1 Tax=Poseidonocella sp. HB161398 TaxID=2320855 RepID=UPI00110897E2|nr:FAD-dependent oxidoreductase [Poseidonocella sp. HB161398]